MFASFEDEAQCNAALHELARHDKAIRHALTQFGTPPFWQRKTGFAALAQIILEQQVSLASAQAVQRRVLAAAGAWSATAVLKLTADGLGKAGVTRPKQRALLALAQECDTKQLKLSSLNQAPDDEVYAALTAIKGIGPWTANVYLIIALLRADVWPLHDVALHEAMKLVSGMQQRPGSEEAQERAMQWQPYRSAAARLLWHVRLKSSGREFTA